MKKEKMEMPAIPGINIFLTVDIGNLAGNKDGKEKKDDKKQDKMDDGALIKKLKKMEKTIASMNSSAE